MVRLIRIWRVEFSDLDCIIRESSLMIFRGRFYEESRDSGRAFFFWVKGGRSFF